MDKSSLSTWHVIFMHTHVYFLCKCPGVERTAHCLLFIAFSSLAGLDMGKFFSCLDKHKRKISMG